MYSCLCEALRAQLEMRHSTSVHIITNTNRRSTVKIEINIKTPDILCDTIYTLNVITMLGTMNVSLQTQHSLFARQQEVHGSPNISGICDGKILEFYVSKHVSSNSNR